MSTLTSDAVTRAIVRGTIRQPFEPWMQNASTSFDILVGGMSASERARHRSLMIIKLRVLKQELKRAAEEGATLEEIECLASLVRLTRYLLRI